MGGGGGDECKNDMEPRAQAHGPFSKPPPPLDSHLTSGGCGCSVGGVCEPNLILVDSRLGGDIARDYIEIVTTGNNPTGVPYVRALFLVPGGKTEPQTKPYPLDMWKYGSALQQRPEDRSLYGRGATVKTMHPEPSLKPF
uniref:Retrotransposon protein, putative, Ty3-gypsy subclass n=1 Tax=Oryza sativa subsp. japonica TaxID=39947 RepID=Q7XFQ2_ORYSJ|nr:retrotransposon protein, putative, Ty3-gypsy subclass [Oryza sativa Japonica Group]